MIRLALTILALAAAAAPARAQLTGRRTRRGYAPNFYNRQTQPLSPYLNLLRGGNNAVNYFYGVRQGTGAGYQGMMNQTNVGPRQTFFPVVDTLADLLPEGERNAPRMAPTGHAVGFNNTMNYFGPSPRPGSASRAGDSRVGFALSPPRDGTVIDRRPTPTRALAVARPAPVRPGRRRTAR